MKQTIIVCYILIPCTACAATYEASQQRPQEPATETQTIPGLMIPPDTLASARGQTFLATVGEKLHRYWKISVERQQVCA